MEQWTICLYYSLHLWSIYVLTLFFLLVTEQLLQTHILLNLYRSISVNDGHLM